MNRELIAEELSLLEFEYKYIRPAIRQMLEDDVKRYGVPEELIMGYTTRYSLKTNVIVAGKIAELMNDVPLFDVIVALREASDDAKIAITATGASEEPCKWYEHEQELKDFSTHHPNILFSLHGEGEENEDVWNEYYLNGRVQIEKAKFQIDPFDIKKLR